MISDFEYFLKIVREMSDAWKEHEKYTSPLTRSRINTTIKKVDKAVACLTKKYIEKNNQQKALF